MQKMSVWTVITHSSAATPRLLSSANRRWRPRTRSLVANVGSDVWFHALADVDFSEPFLPKTQSFFPQWVSVSFRLFTTKKQLPRCGELRFHCMVPWKQKWVCRNLKMVQKPEKMTAELFSTQTIAFPLCDTKTTEFARNNTFLLSFIYTEYYTVIFYFFKRFFYLIAICWSFVVQLFCI